MEYFLNGTNELIYKTEIVTDVENKHDLQEGKVGEGQIERLELTQTQYYI